jgi:hypothetical protein
MEAYHVDKARQLFCHLRGWKTGRSPASQFFACIRQEQIMSIFGSIMGAIFGSGSAQASASPTAAPSEPQAQTVDVAAIVDKAAEATGEKLAWRTSIVDLMKALGLDSSLTARKQLASELKYTGDTNDSAIMSVWLHKQILGKLAVNGGKLSPT